MGHRANRDDPPFLALRLDNINNGITGYGSIRTHMNNHPALTNLFPEMYLQTVFQFFREDLILHDDVNRVWVARFFNEFGFLPIKYRLTMLNDDSTRHLWIEFTNNPFYVDYPKLNAVIENSNRTYEFSKFFAKRLRGELPSLGVVRVSSTLDSLYEDMANMLRRKFTQYKERVQTRQDPRLTRDDVFKTMLSYAYTLYEQFQNLEIKLREYAVIQINVNLDSRIDEIMAQVNKMQPFKRAHYIRTVFECLAESAAIEKPFDCAGQLAQEYKTYFVRQLGVFRDEWQLEPFVVQLNQQSAHRNQRIVQFPADVRVEWSTYLSKMFILPPEDRLTTGHLLDRLVQSIQFSTDLPQEFNAMEHEIVRRGTSDNWKTCDRLLWFLALHLPAMKAVAQAFPVYVPLEQIDVKGWWFEPEEPPPVTYYPPPDDSHLKRFNTDYLEWDYSNANDNNDHHLQRVHSTLKESIMKVVKQKISTYIQDYYQQFNNKVNSLNVWSEGWGTTQMSNPKDLIQVKTEDNEESRELVRPTRTWNNNLTTSVPSVFMYKFEMIKKAAFLVLMTRLIKAPLKSFPITLSMRFRAFRSSQTLMMSSLRIFRR